MRALSNVVVITAILVLEELRSASNNVRALVSQGVVTLQGTVPTDDLSRELENRISVMPGVQRVINELVVKLK